MNSQQTAKTSTSNRTYWAQVVVLGLVVGFGLQFAQAWTNAPAGGPTLGTITGPITTSGDSQTKTGNLILTNDIGVGRNATFGNFVSVNKTTGLCLGSSGCKKSWDEVSGVPAGAVMAFNLDSCPTGWGAYAAANGRNIIGIDPDPLKPAYNTRGARAGRDTVMLSSNQIPASDHYHNILANIKVDADTCTGDCVFNSSALYAGRETNQGDDTEYDIQATAVAPTVGRTSNALVPSARVAVPVMDPYVVLRYCVKN